MKKDMKLLRLPAECPECGLPLNPAEDFCPDCIETAPERIPEPWEEEYLKDDDDSWRYGDNEEADEDEEPEEECEIKEEPYDEEIKNRLFGEESNDFEFYNDDE